MNNKPIDLLNIFLMVFSLILSLKIPFELFLFSYAVLGPLHYLTEINWLDQKKYFLQSKRDATVLYLLSGFITLIVFYSLAEHWGIGKTLIQSLSPDTLATLDKIRPWGVHATFVAFLSCLGFMFIPIVWARYALVLALITAAFFIETTGLYVSIFGVFLPTIIHVSIFTSIFMLIGAMRSNQWTGYLSVAVYFICCSILLFANHKFKGYSPGLSTIKAFNLSTFASVSSNLITLLEPNKENDLMSMLGLRVQAFVAFAYTYHYLNWFSKTNVIGWLRIPKMQLAISLTVWAAAVTLYFINYRTGLLALLFLSMLHVYLEFPLNIQSFRDMGGLIRQRIGK
jgi:hypothetical protein